MDFRAFIQTHVYEKQAAPKEKDKSSIQCLECDDRNLVYRDQRCNSSASYLSQSWPEQNQRRSVTALNMFSLEPVPGLKKIQHVSLFEVYGPLLTTRTACVEMVTSSSRRKVIRIHVVGVDSWEVVKEVSLLQDPVALAVDGACLCVATSDSMVDQQRKQIVGLSGAKGLLSTSDQTANSGFVWKDVALSISICTASPTPSVSEKPTTNLPTDGVLVFTERDIFSLRLVPLEEQIQALVKLERVEEALLLLDGVQSSCPIDSYESCIGEDFQSQLDQENKARDLQVVWQEDRNTFHHYLGFLGDFLNAVKGTEKGLECIKEVDCALLRLYVELEDNENLQQLVAFPNECSLTQCIPVLEQHNRFFALGSLYQSHGNHIDAIKTWVKIADGIHKDSFCSDVYGHIVWTLSQLQDRDAVWRFADWTLQKNQEEVRHHNRLALAYVTQALQQEEEADLRKTRGKLQEQLWESKFYDVTTVYERVKSTTLHAEKAILLSRMDEHSQALQVLVHQERDLQAAEGFCCRASQGRDSQFRQTLLLSLLQIYLSSRDHASAAVDLLNSNTRVFAAEKVIQLLPDSWSVQLVSQFFVGSLRETLHQRRMARLQKALSQTELMRHKVVWTQASQTKFRLDKGQKCKALLERRSLWGLSISSGCGEIESLDVGSSSKHLDLDHQPP
ncbi:Transforming growth factor-beta receptor-associated protein 1 [Collichthys lucidus]|uniref:Transforming growth factor-beta receptor-associated protein 1 n=1 Tax=Collichthys lucidus TaxID=240159 RepID=A0A4V6ATC9_COLLU|nr:Transforming growth factor-beta receptor-associated protein 1 [Collichthys lucidus]